MAELLETIGGVYGVVGLEGVAVGPGGHVLTDAVVVDVAHDFEGDGHFTSCAVDDFPGSSEELGEVYFAAFEVS